MVNPVYWQPQGFLRQATGTLLSMPGNNDVPIRLPPWPDGARKFYRQVVIYCGLLVESIAHAIAMDDPRTCVYR